MQRLNIHLSCLLTLVVALSGCGQSSPDDTEQPPTVEPEKSQSSTAEPRERDLAKHPRAVARKRSLPARTSQALLVDRDLKKGLELWEQWIADDSAAALEWLEQFRGSDAELAYGFQDQLMNAARLAMFVSDPANFLSQVEAAGDLNIWPTAKFSAEQLEYVEDWILAQEDATLKMGGAELFLRITADDDPRAALDWISSQEFTEDPGATHLRRSSLDIWASNAIEETGSLEEICSYLHEQRAIPESAVLLSEQINGWATGGIEGRLNAAGLWLGAQEPSPYLDPSYAAFARRIALHDDELDSALIWVDQISDAEQKEKMRTEIVEIWERANQAPEE